MRSRLKRIVVVVLILVILASGITLILAKERSAVGSREEKTEETQLIVEP